MFYHIRFSCAHVWVYTCVSRVHAEGQRVLILYLESQGRLQAVGWCFPTELSHFFFLFACLKDWFVCMPWLALNCNPSVCSWDYRALCMQGKDYPVHCAAVV